MLGDIDTNMYLPMESKVSSSIVSKGDAHGNSLIVKIQPSDSNKYRQHVCFWLLICYYIHVVIMVVSMHCNRYKITFNVFWTYC